jgi:hypothetical protein
MSEPAEPPLLDKIRNMWEFAAITQFFYLFFDMFGLEDFDVEVLSLLPTYLSHRQIQDTH